MIPYKIQYNTIRHNTIELIRHNTIQYGGIEHNTTKYQTIQDNPTLCFDADKLESEVEEAGQLKEERSRQGFRHGCFIHIEATEPSVRFDLNNFKSLFLDKVNQKQNAL